MDKEKSHLCRRRTSLQAGPHTDQQRRFLEEELAQAWRQGAWRQGLPDDVRVSQLLSRKWGMGIWRPRSIPSPSEWTKSTTKVAMGEVHAAVQGATTRRPVDLGDRRAAHPHQGSLETPDRPPPPLPSRRHRDRSKPAVEAPTMCSRHFPLSLCARWYWRFSGWSVPRIAHHWHGSRSQAGFLSRHNGKAWTQGDRAVNVMWCLGRAYHRSVPQRGQAALRRSCSLRTCGCIFRRRREEAVLLHQRVLSVCAKRAERQTDTEESPTTIRYLAPREWWGQWPKNKLC